MINTDFIKSNITIFLQFITIPKNIKFAFTLIIIFLSLTSALSQFSDKRLEVTSKDAFLISRSTLNSKFPPVFNLFYGLLNCVNASVYLLIENVGTCGHSPFFMYTDIALLHIIDKADILSSNIKIETLKIENASEFIDKTDFAPFCNYKVIKYIHSKLRFDQDAIQLKKIKNFNNKC